MKSISIHPAALLLLILAAAGIAGVFANRARFASGHMTGIIEGRLVTQRDAATSLSTLMTQGLTVRHDDGRKVHYVLRPVAAEN